MSILNNLACGTLLVLAITSCKTSSPKGGTFKDDPPATQPPADTPPATQPPTDTPPATPQPSPFGANDFAEIQGQYTGVMERNGRPCGITILNRVESWRILREMDVTFTEWRLLNPNNPAGSTVKASVYFSEPKIGPNTWKVEKEACGETISAHKDNLITVGFPSFADGGGYEIKTVDLTLKDKVPASFTYDEQGPVVFGRACDRLLTRRGNGEYLMRCVNLKKVGN